MDTRTTMLPFRSPNASGSQFINDLFDFTRGSDRDDRLGPERACAQGWITPRAMKRGIAVVLILACAAGCSLLPFGGWPLVGIGTACVVFAFLYTTLLSYMGCGDLLVWIFFGFVPVCGTYFVQAGDITPSVWWLAAATGLVTDTLLVLNNYRDREQDALSGKRTLIVALGERFGSHFYWWQGVLACLCTSMLSSIPTHGLPFSLGSTLCPTTLRGAIWYAFIADEGSTAFSVLLREICSSSPYSLSWDA